MTRRLGIAFIFGLLFAAITGSRALAQGNGAIIINIQTPCHFFDGDGNWTSAIGNCDFQIVATPGLEVVNVTVHGQVPPSAGGTGARFDFGNTGIPCVIDNTPYSTTQWQETVTPTGEVAMHCNFR